MSFRIIKITPIKGKSVKVEYVPLATTRPGRAKRRLSALRAASAPEVKFRLEKLA